LCGVKSGVFGTVDEILEHDEESIRLIEQDVVPRAGNFNETPGGES